MAAVAVADVEATAAVVVVDAVAVAGAVGTAATGNFSRCV